jgi:hypothetical protein
MIKMMVTVVCVYTICWLPYNVLLVSLRVLQFWSRQSCYSEAHKMEPGIKCYNTKHQQHTTLSLIRSIQYYYWTKLQLHYEQLGQLRDVFYLMELRYVYIARSNEILGWVGVGKIKSFRTVQEQCKVWISRHLTRMTFVYV